MSMGPTNTNHSPLTKRSSVCGGARMVQSCSASTNTSMDYDLLSAPSRHRQTKKDEAIRKKIEQELSKKRGGTTRIKQTKKVAGSVSALRPSHALTLKENILVIEAVQLMAAKRSDCVLVVDDEKHLRGIFTAKDLAYRVIASNLDARTTLVSHIMTREPICVTADTSANDALNLMASRGFRHLPVCNEEGDIFGLLDIAKCLYEALDKMERAYGSSRKLYDALQGVEREWANIGPAQLVQSMGVLRDKMSCPDLRTVLDQHAEPVQVSVKTQVRDVAKLMKEYHATAVLVMDHGELAGIFTSKDIVLRVIAAGIAPDNCSVVRVMTPHPDTATPSTSILEALKKMHDGHYLNLPVMDDERNVLGVVDVLRLTFAALEQIRSIEGGGNGNNEGDSGKFWENIAAPDDHAESESIVSETLTADTRAYDTPSTPQPSGSKPSLLPAHYHFAVSPPGGSSTPTTTTTTVTAHEEDMRSVLSINAFSFKFTFKNRTFRFRADYTDFPALRDHICRKLMSENGLLKDSRKISIAYYDDEDDQVLMTCNADLIDAVQLARKMDRDRVRLTVFEGSMQPQDASVEVAPPAIAVSEADVIRKERSQHNRLRKQRKSHVSYYSSQGDEEADVETTSEGSDSGGSVGHWRQRSRKRRVRDNEPESEMLVPAAIAFLGVAILGIFALGR